MRSNRTGRTTAPQSFPFGIWLGGLSFILLHIAFFVYFAPADSLHSFLLLERNVLTSGKHLVDHLIPGVIPPAAVSGRIDPVELA